MYFSRGFRLGAMKILLAALALSLVVLLWIRWEKYQDVTWFIFPVFLELPLVVAIIFSQYRENRYFDTLGPLVILLIFFLGVEYGNEWGKWGLILFSVSLILMFRLALSPMISSFPWKKWYAWFLVILAVSTLAYYAIDYHWIKSRSVGAVALTVAIPFFFLRMLPLPQMALIAFPWYLFVSWKNGWSKERYEFISASAAFVVFAFLLLPICEVLVRTFADPCYEKVGTYSPLFKKFPEKKLVCVTPGSEGPYGVSYFRTFRGADYETFEELGSAYARDKKRVYYGNRVLDVDLATFVKVKNYHFALDKHGLLYKGKRTDEMETYVAKSKNFKLEFPKELDAEVSVRVYPVVFERGPHGEECRGAVYDKDGGEDFGYDVQVFWPNDCWRTHKRTFLSDVEVDGVRGRKYLTEDGYEETFVQKGNFNYFIRKKGDWHEKMIPRFSFLEE